MEELLNAKESYQKAKELKVDENQKEFERIKILINQAIKNGEFNVKIWDIISSFTANILKENRYKVSFLNDYHDTWTEISWNFDK